MRNLKIECIVLKIEKLPFLYQSNAFSLPLKEKNESL